MRLRSKLAWQFTIVVALALLSILMVIYVLNLYHTRTVFFSRLEERAKMVAYFYWEKDILHPNDFQQLEQRYVQRLPYESVRIYDKTRQEVLVENFDPHKRLPALDLARLKREKLYFTVSDDYLQTCVLLYSGRKGETWVAVTAYDIYGNIRLQSLAFFMLSAYLASLGFIFLLGRILIKNGLKHIQNIVREVQTIQADSLAQRLASPPYQDEIGELVVTFNQMLERLDKVFTSHKLFVSQASHELRTPLAIMLGEVEVALARSRTEDVYKNTLGSVHQTLLQAKDLVDSLLLFAQLENSLEVPNIEPLRIDEIVWEVFDSIKKEYPQSHWRINLENMPENMEELLFYGNRQWLRMALHNFMRNAVKYGNQNPIDLSLHYVSNQLFLKIQDYGLGISQEDLPHIFIPFYRGTNTRSKIQGTGIGLALTKRILDAHDVHIKINSEVGKGTIIELAFELA